MGSTRTEDIQLFEFYELGKLDQKSRLNFELRLSLDKEFKTDYELYKLVIQSSRYYRKEKIIQFIKTNAATKLTGNIWGNTWTKISALVIALTGLLIFLSEQNKNSIDIESIETDQTDTLKDNRQIKP